MPNSNQRNYIAFHRFCWTAVSMEGRVQSAMGATIWSPSSQPCYSVTTRYASLTDKNIEMHKRDKCPVEGFISFFVKSEYVEIMNE